jgi:hypothetical protein
MSSRRKIAEGKPLHIVAFIEKQDLADRKTGLLMRERNSFFEEEKK